MELTMGDRIRFVRQFRGLTQTELAEKVGLPPGENGRIRISQYENGTHVPKEEMLEILGRYKRNVEVVPVDYRYSIGTQHKANRNKVEEYFFLGW